MNIVWKLDQTIIASGGVERIVLNRARRGVAGSQTNILPVDCEKITVQVATFVHVKDRFRVAIREPLEVDDDDAIF